MQELRLKSRMMKRIEDWSQKDRRDDAERFFERHPKETFDAILADIDKMQDDLVDEAETNSASVGELKQISNELRSLMNAM